MNMSFVGVGCSTSHSFFSACFAGEIISERKLAFLWSLGLQERLVFSVGVLVEFSPYSLDKEVLSGGMCGGFPLCVKET